MPEQTSGRPRAIAAFVIGTLLALAAGFGSVFAAPGIWLAQPAFALAVRWWRGQDKAPAAAEPGARRSAGKRDMAHSRSARGRAKAASSRASSRGDSSQASSNTRTQRQLRVGEELRHALSALLARGELRDPHLAAIEWVLRPENWSGRMIVRSPVAEAHSANSTPAANALPSAR